MSLIIGDDKIKSIYVGDRKIKRAYLGDDMVYSATTNSTILPKEYVQLEYIKIPTRSLCLINTKIPSNMVYAIQWKSSALDFSTITFMCGSSYQFTSSNKYVYNHYAVGPYLYFYNFSTYSYTLDYNRPHTGNSSIPQLSDLHEYKMNLRNNASLIVDSTKYEYTAMGGVPGSGGYNQSVNFGIFGVNSNWSSIQYSIGMQCYYFRIIGSGDELLRDFVPCKRLSDLEAGLYDLVSKAAFFPENLGVMIAGPEIIKEDNDA